MSSPFSRGGPSATAQIVCGGCSTLLMYPAGASQVMCQRCSHTTRVTRPQAQQLPAGLGGGPPAPPRGRGDTTSRIMCTGCRLLLSYPRGAQSVRCAVCSTIMQVPRVAHVQCGGCHTRLMYPHNASSVRCSLCNYITSVRGGVGGGGGGGGGGGDAARPPPLLPGGGPMANSPSTATTSPSLLTTIPTLNGRATSGLGTQATVGLEVVMVENPSTCDERGNEIPNLMVGVKVER